MYRSPGGLRILLVCAVGMSACTSSSGPPFVDEVDAVRFHIASSTPLHEAGEVIGWNLGKDVFYAAEDDPERSAWRTPEMEQAIARLAELQPANGEPPWLRYSGLQIDGEFGEDGYHFYRYVDPEIGADERPEDFMAPHQYFAAFNEVGSRNNVMLNYASGTVAEAADYATYLLSDEASDPLVQTRAFWGQQTPYDVSALEVGNEVYLPFNTGASARGYSYANPSSPSGGDEAWHGMPSDDPNVYQMRANAYIDAIGDALPDTDIRYWIPLSDSYSDFSNWGTFTEAAAALEPVLSRAEVEAAVVHNYMLLDLAIGEKLGLDACNDPQWVLAGSSVVEPRLLELRDIIRAIDHDPPLKMVINEYDVAGPEPCASLYEQADTLIAGVGLADMLVTYLRIGVEVGMQHLFLRFPTDGANGHVLESNPFRSLGGGEIRSMPSYYAQQMVADHLGAHVVELTPTNMKTEEHLGYAYPILNAVALSGSEGMRTFLAVNRSLEDEVTIVLSADTPISTAQAVALTADTPDADALAGDEITPTTVEIEVKGGRALVVAPPHSLIAVDLSPQ